jgi:hypothetical protein
MGEPVPPSTTPITSAYQDTPTEPTVYLTGNKDANQAQQKAAAWYTRIYGGSATVVHGSAPSESPGSGATVPALTTAYQTAPDFVPNAPPAPNPDGGGPAVPSSSDPFYVDLGALRTAEQTCLNATRATIQAYQTLLNTVSPAISSGTIFGQDVEDTLYTTGGGKNLGPMKTAYDQYDKEGQQVAAATDPAMQQLLYEVGGVIELMGQFNALLNNAGQMYTWTDDQSAFPPPT